MRPMDSARVARAFVGVAAVALVLVLVLSALPLTAGLARGASRTVATDRTGGPPTALPTGKGSSSSGSACNAFSAAWERLFAGLSVAPAPSPSELSGCVAAPDESSLSLLSTTAGSGQRASVTLLLPPVGSALASAMARLSIRSWASGVPCSVDGATEVSVDLVPPLSPYATGTNLNWSIAAPAYDLVPAASCDPSCTNDTTFLAFDGARVCEDEVVAAGGSNPPVSPTGGLAPGDTITITLAGGGTSAAPLSVWVNDTTHPSDSQSFNYGAAATRLGIPLVPRFSTSSIGQPVWGLSSALSIVATNCPLPGPTGTSCDSYSPSLWNALTPVQVESIGFYNASDGRYDTPYDQVALASSTGGCLAGPIACAQSRLGSTYPEWSLLARGGSLDWAFGGSYANAVRSYASGAGNLTPTSSEPIAMFPPIAAVGGGPATSFSERIADPAGIRSVNFTVWYCGATNLSATLSGGAGNSSSDGNWTASIAGSPFNGRVGMLTRVTTAAGTVLAPWITPTDVAATGYPGCTPTAAAVPTGLGATPVADGYLVNWTAPPNETALVVVHAALANGSSTNTTLRPFSPAVLDLGVGNVAFNLSIASVDGWNLTSGFSGPLLGAPTLAPLAATGPIVSASTTWLGATPVNVSGTVAGGLAPYSVTVQFGDGTSTTLFTLGSWSTGHDYAGYYGLARVRASVTDAVGDQSTGATAFLSVLATPLGLHASATAGDSTVSLNWQLPPSPSAPVTGYRVFYTSDPTLASFPAWAASSNATLPGVTVWNTSATFLFLAVPNGGVLYAQVVAFNLYGMGWLPPGSPTPLVGRPAPFTLSPIVTSPGGAAPFHDDFSATSTLGSNDSVVAAYYSFPDGSTANAAPFYLNGTFYLNASYEFVSPGTYVVVLHAIDVFYETQIALTTVRVSVGVSPALAAAVVNGLAYAGSPVDLEATATGGSGSYLVNWTFGDGGVANGTTTIHTFAEPGTYTVLVTAVDLQTRGASSYLLPLLVYALPALFVSVVPGPNGSYSYAFHASVGGGSGPSTIVWSFGDGALGRGTDVTHDYLDKGTYKVNVTATDPAGRTGSTTFNLSAFPTPTTPASSSNALSLLDIGLAVIAAVLFVTILVLSARRKAPPESTAIVPAASEDGEVSLT